MWTHLLTKTQLLILHGRLDPYKIILATLILLCLNWSQLSINLGGIKHFWLVDWYPSFWDIHLITWSMLAPLTSTVQKFSMVRHLTCDLQRFWTWCFYYSNIAHSQKGAWHIFGKIKNKEKDPWFLQEMRVRRWYSDTYGNWNTYFDSASTNIKIIMFSLEMMGSACDVACHYGRKYNNFECWSRLRPISV